MLIYFAAPLFSVAEREFNQRLIDRLEALGYQVFLPQRDGVKLDRPPYDTMTWDERQVAIFELDRDKILACDVFLFVLDGRVPDEGACVELGIAYCDTMQRRPDRRLIGLKTDLRATGTTRSSTPWCMSHFNTLPIPKNICSRSWPPSTSEPRTRRGVPAYARQRTLSTDLAARRKPIARRFHRI